MQIFEWGCRLLDWWARGAPQFTACFGGEIRSKRIIGMFASAFAGFIAKSSEEKRFSKVSDTSLRKRVAKLTVVTACAVYADRFCASHFPFPSQAYLFRAVLLGLYMGHTGPAIPAIGDRIFNAEKNFYPMGTREVFEESKKTNRKKESYLLACYRLRNAIAGLTQIFLNRVFLPNALPKYLRELSSPILIALLSSCANDLVDRAVFYKWSFLYQNMFTSKT